jgi:GTPase SAR1 family protein
MKERNYQILENIKLIDNNEIFNRLKEINKVIDYKDKKFKDKIYNIIDLLDKIINITPVKVVFLGEPGAGKTSIIARYIYNTYDEFMSATGTNFSVKTEWFKEENQIIKFEIWDTAGQEKFRSLAKVFYKNSSICILVYDITKRKTFEELKNYWYEEIKSSAGCDICKCKF